MRMKCGSLRIDYLQTSNELFLKRVDKEYNASSFSTEERWLVVGPITALSSLVEGELLTWDDEGVDCSAWMLEVLVVRFCREVEDVTKLSFDRVCWNAEVDWVSNDLSWNSS
jgi:hypothetical protein